MFRIVKKERLNPTVTKMVIDAPFIAKKAEPGQFIILRALEDSERIPLTIADYDRQGGTVTIIYQIVGGSTMELDTLEEGQTLHDFVGPLGVATHTEGLKKVRGRRRRGLRHRAARDQEAARAGLRGARHRRL